MKKYLSIMVIIGLLATSTAFAADGVGKEKSGQVKEKVEQTTAKAEKATTTEETEEQTDATVKEDEKTEEQTDTTVNEDEGAAEQTGESGTAQTAKDSLKALKAKFKDVKNNKEQRKEVLAQIAQLKRESKDDSIGVFVEGQDLTDDDAYVPPVIKEDRTLAPVRAIMKALGADVEWDEDSKTVTITKNLSDTVADSVYGSVYDGDSKIVIKLQLGSDVALVNGAEVKLDVPAQKISSERTYVPLRFIAENFKQQVDWDGESNTVIIENEDKNNQ